jgi:hypothetical protein
MKSALFLMLLLVAGAIRAADAPDLADSMCLRGSVVEAKEVDAYTYLLLKTVDGETWAAIDRAPVQPGADVTIAQATVMKDFWSRTLDKSFEWIVFGRLAESCGPQAPAAGGIAAHHGMAAKPAAGTPISVARAAGPHGRTVSEIVAGSAALGDQPVAVRGQVVKFTSDVMGRNWIHLQDGSGSAADGNNDILVTTLAQAESGEIVLVKGVVRTNRDFGSGYAYKVLIEDAALER